MTTELTPESAEKTPDTPKRRRRRRSKRRGILHRYRKTWKMLMYIGIIFGILLLAYVVMVLITNPGTTVAG